MIAKDNDFKHITYKVRSTQKEDLYEHRRGQQ
jgi:hypothetical protein